MIRNKILLLLAGLLLASMSIGCAPQYTPPDYSNVFWPKPPEKKRIQLLKIIRTDIDVRTPELNEELFGGSAYFAFKKPSDVVADNAGTIFVSDAFNGTIYKINFEQGKVGNFGPEGKWKEPRALAIDSKNGLLGIIDRRRVLIYSIATGKPAFDLTGAEFNKPSGITFDPERKLIYVSDIRYHVIQQFDYTGKLIRFFGGRGSAEGHLYFPGHMAVDKQGLLHVVDIMNWRIQVFDSEGNFIRKFGDHGSRPGMFGRPKGIAVSKNGTVLVTDGDFNRITLFNSSGISLLLFGQYGSGGGQFLNPYGIFIDDNDKFYVVDQSNRRLHVYQLYTDEYYKGEADKEITSAPEPIAPEAAPAKEAPMESPTPEPTPEPTVEPTPEPTVEPETTPAQ